ncbi:methyltransferase domain-containing protein [Streptomyces sp. ICN441]|uniref:Methyltransferase domain-containing protein n=1 Tax=Streptomyces tirandamycinicus TaxID=2174846 RepID=A0A2S1SU80_9ACTN|nr:MULTISPECIES: methyltransferase domain-containing protein [Streptomyces]AWI29963.1 methyltransferase domain-containing protein [Streptomyces tirandamycinicus]MCY0982343.1 methyltransferase [Streptomyces tirandamycinicus]TFE57232.1 methyltransferase domain-containing protein [Streptomyces sp. ICN441]
MDNALGYELGSWVVSQIRSPDRPARTTFTLLDQEWELLPDVFPPYTDPGPELFASWVPYEKGSRFLEMGCGAGVAAVLAAQRGARRVVALDINPAAAENTRRNAARHGVSDRVTALSGDLFDPLEPAEPFDLVFWNTPFIEAPESRPYAGQIERAVFDPGYGTVRRFFRDVVPHLAPDARVYLGTSEAMGNPDKLLRAAAETGFEGRRYRSESVELPAADFPASSVVAAHTNERGTVDMDFTMYEFLCR